MLKCPYYPRGTWVAQSVKCLTSAQVMISWLVSSSPALGSVLTARSLEPVSDSVSPSLSAPPLLMLCLCLCLSKINKRQKVKTKSRGAWVAQSVKCLTSAQVMILRSMGLCPMLGSVLTAHSLEPALDSVSPSLSAPPLLMLCLCLSKMNIKNKKKVHPFYA